MKKTSLLVVDNDAKYTKMFAHSFREKSEYRIYRAHDIQEAMEIVKKEEIDCGIIDINLGKSRKKGDRELDGLSLPQSIHGLRPDTGIILYSSLIDGSKDAETLIATGKSRGASAVVNNEELLNTDVVVTLIRAAIAARPRHDFTVEFEESIRMAAVLEDFDAESLKGLLRKFTPKYDYYAVKPLRAGYSGAAVLLVSAANSRSSTVAAEWILKIAKSQQELLDEVRQRPALGTPESVGATGSHEDEVLSSGSIFGLRTAFIRGMMLLREFLFQGSYCAADDLVLKGVVDRLLAPAANASNASTPTLELKAKAALEMLDFLDAAAKWSQVLCKQDLAAISETATLLRKTVETGGGLPWGSGPSRVLHGDFHAANVFVASGSEPRYIDFARRGTFPRFFDFAALDVDIDLASPPESSGEEYAWNEIPKWKSARLALFPFTAVFETPTSDRGERMRQLLLLKLKEMNATPAEYAGVLVFQYWRYLRFSSIAPPKKVLACHLASSLARLTGVVVA